MPEIGWFRGWLRGWFAGSGLDSFTGSLVRAEFFPVNALNAFLPLSLSLSPHRPALFLFFHDFVPGIMHPSSLQARPCLHLCAYRFSEHQEPPATGSILRHSGNFPSPGTAVYLLPHGARATEGFQVLVTLQAHADRFCPSEMDLPQTIPPRGISEMKAHLILELKIPEGYPSYFKRNVHLSFAPRTGRAEETRTRNAAATLDPPSKKGASARNGAARLPKHRAMKACTRGARRIHHN